MEKAQQPGLAKALRRRQTEAEKKLRAHLRNRQLGGVKFRRQQSIGFYVVDFVSFDRKLIIELDGGQHNEMPAMEKDERRTRWLEGEGFRVSRFWNNEVLSNMEGVIARIRETLR